MVVRGEAGWWSEGGSRLRSLWARQAPTWTWGHGNVRLLAPLSRGNEGCREGGEWKEDAW